MSESDNSDNKLNTPERWQQRTRHALRNLQLNREDELPQRRCCLSRPETPTPTPGYAERMRTRTRSINRESRNADLQISPRRRHSFHSGNENIPLRLSAGHFSTSILHLDHCVLPSPVQSQEQPQPTPPQVHQIHERQRTEHKQNFTSSSAPQPIPHIRPSLRQATQSSAQEASHTHQSLLPNARSVAQQRRRARERLEQLEVGQPHTLPNARSVAQQRRRARERLEVGQSSVPDPGQNESLRQDARSVAQQRRRARERLERQQRVQNGADVSLEHTFMGHNPLPTPPLTQIQSSEVHNSLSTSRLNAPESTSNPIRNSNNPAPRARHRNHVVTTSNRLFLAARRPYHEPAQRHDIGRMIVPCEHCGALHWLAEKLAKSTIAHPRFPQCCMEGKIDLPALETPPEPLQHLLTSLDTSSATFRDVMWKYNRAFAFTSVGVKEDHSANFGPPDSQGRRRPLGPPVYRISGELHHRSGALIPDEGQDARYAQLYVYEPRAALDTRIQNNSDLDENIMRDLQAMLNTHHQYVPLYRHAYEILQQYDVANDVVIRLRLTPGLDRRRYNLPTADEVAVILPDNPSTHPRDIILRLRSGPLQRISDLHPAYAPLQYPLLFPRGENGWHPELRLQETTEQQHERRHLQHVRHQERRDVGLEMPDSDPEDFGHSRRLTLTSYIAYRLHYRPHEYNLLLRGGRLFTRYVVDMFASADQQRLSYIEQHQSIFRAARFNNLEDAAVGDDDNLDLNDLGRRIILPSSHTSSPRYMGQAFQDSMALARFYRKVDIFITVTTNPHWPEIERELLPGQTPYDRPGLIARVFQLKKKAILDYIYNKSVFGPAIAYVYTIEFQKRGLPHMHCLIFLKDPYKLLTPEAIDLCIWARWPDPETQPLLFETVKKYMVHGPCGAEKPDASCMVNGKCSKGFPKEFQPRTTMDGHGYPQYYRPDDGSIHVVGTKHPVEVDNRWIVPYSPFLCALFDCHINMECAVSLSSFKYIFKYIQKGDDRAALDFSERNEVKRHLTGRYICPPSAAWRIFHFPIREQTPNVLRLEIHLPNHQMVTFNPNDDLDTVLQRGANQRTSLTAFFEANADNGPLGEEARKHTYQEFPQHFVYHTNMRKWSIRKAGFALGRMYFISPTAGEQFYLRTLLTVIKGPKSFEDLRRIPGTQEPLPTFYAACLARGLLEDDGEWRICLQEASELQTGTRLRHLFATLLLFTEIAQPDILWIEFRHYICDDLERRLRAMGIQNPEDDDIYDYGLYLLDKILSDSGHSLADFPSMPQSNHDWSSLTENPLIAEQLNYNRENELADLATWLPTLNTDQKTAYTRIINAVDNGEQKLFFVNGPGGTGKTYVYNTLCAKLRGEGNIVLCVSSSGISALLIRGGRTAHSMFKIPIDTLSDSSLCNIPKNSHRADLMRAAKVIIWDEISAQHRYAIETVDRTLQDICDNDHSFGGKVVVIGGDFLQTLPIVPKGSRQDIINATVQSSYLWDHVEILHLRQNMRLQQGTPDMHQFAQWLLDVGNGRNMINESQVKLPENMIVDNADSLINCTYPGIYSTPPPPSEYFLHRMILAPRNTDVREMNEQILERMSGDAQQFVSADHVIHELGADPDDHTQNIPVEVLRSIDSSSLPPGELNLKIGCPIILLRNLSPSTGLCNGTRMIVTRMGSRVLEVRLIGGEHDGEIAMIPRISLTPSAASMETTFHFKRLQFPVRLAFALSINKAQGQSVKHVGLNLKVPVFAHGQLYVALSRATSSRNIKILLSDTENEFLTTNVVYEEVLL